MGRAGQKVIREDVGLADRSGVLAKVFPRATVDAMIEAAEAREQRVRLLPAWAVPYYVLALALFIYLGGARVMRKLAGISPSGDSKHWHRPLHKSPDGR